MAEFARHAVAHPEVDEQLPEDAYIYFEFNGEPEFNAYSRSLAERRRAENDHAIVCVRAKGLLPGLRVAAH